MGELTVKYIQNKNEKNQYLKFLLNDVAALDQLIEADLFEKGKQRIGAEQELCLIDDLHNPAKNGPEILDRIDDPHLTTELARFNLEINLDPFEIGADCLQKTEKQLTDLLQKTATSAADLGSRVLLTGILPTIRFGHVEPEWMTPMDRYQILSDVIKTMRGGNFEIHIQGVDELITSLDSVLFEACNTSFQLHLQLRPEDFAKDYNWSQLIAGPVLAAGANSPLLLGQELWMETRIALFQQSVDSRSSSNHLRAKNPRVRFGNKWLEHSVSELFKDQIARYPLILTTKDLEDSQAILKKGGIPSLKALRLHNGTVYPWNRPCYGLSGNTPHLRIENRYLPSGPSIIDEMANFAFWLGLMKGRPEKWIHFEKQIPFRIAKDNFYRAAKMGLQTIFEWFGERKSAKQLILDQLLPIAYQGLEKCGLGRKEAERYLTIIEKRVDSGQNGAEWQAKNFRSLSEKYGPWKAIADLTKAMHELQQSGSPVHEWPSLATKDYFRISDSTDCVRNIMSSDLFTIRDDEPLMMVKAIMSWKKVRHLPVEDTQGNLIGLFTNTNLKAIESASTDWEKRSIRDVMVKDLVTIDSDTSIASAKSLMEAHGIGCLPIVHGSKLIGLVTDTDLKRLETNTASV